MEPPRPVLTYFANGKGRNELIRLVFAVGRVDYEAELISRSEFRRRRDAGALPFGQLPTLRVGDVVLGQSCAIARYAARRAALYPQDPLQAARCDAIVDLWRDLQDLFYDTLFKRVVMGGKWVMLPRNAAVRGPRLAVFLEASVQPALAGLEAQLAAAAGAGGWISPAGLSFADLAIFDLVRTLEHVLDPAASAAALRPHERVSALVAQVAALPEIRAHLEEHPYKDLRSLFAAPSALRWLQSISCSSLQSCLEGFAGARRRCPSVAG